MAKSHKSILYARDQYVQHEAPADGAVQVGHLLERTANGVAPHSTDGGVLNEVLVAINDRDRGMELGDTYASGDNVKFVSANAGVGAHLVLASGADLGTSAQANATEDDRLVSAGDGTVRVFDDGTSPDDEGAVAAHAIESIDNSGAASGDTEDLASEVAR
jgi:hypothetical protein